MNGAASGGGVEQIGEADPAEQFRTNAIRDPVDDDLCHTVSPCPAQTNMPPETSTRWALIQRLSSLSSAATAGPMSSGRPGRPSAVTLAMKALTCLLSRTAPPAKSVSIAPGAMVFTAIPRGPNSLAR